MKYLPFVFIVLLAVTLRFFSLGSLPVGLSWDEAAIGYNGYGIATVHRDEWLVKMPITFKSFGDFKAAVAIYAAAISTTLFGMNPFAVRFPMAVAGVVTVVATYAIARALFKEKWQALFAMFLVAVSPVNIHYSRIGFESGLAVACVSVGIALFLYAKKYPWLLFGSALMFAVSMYAYHSTKIMVPLLVLLLLVHCWKDVRTHMLYLVIAAVIGMGAMYPLIKETFFGNAGERFFMTSVIADRHGIKPLSVLVPAVTGNVIAHLDPAFLLFGKTSTYRHGNNAFGILGFTECLFLILGIIAVYKTKYRQYLWMLLAVLLGLLPAIISNDVPHSNRAHGMVPWIQLVAVVGVSALMELVKENFKKRILVLIIALTLVQTTYYALEYARIYSKDAAYDFQYGYTQAIAIAREYESSVERVIFTSAYGQPYIYILFYKPLTPIQWQQGALSNYDLRDIVWEQEKNKEHVLIVGTGKEIPQDAPGIVKEIFFPDGNVAFRIVRNP